MPKDHQHYKPGRGIHPLRLKKIHAICQDIQVYENWTELDDWTDAQQDIDAQVQGPPTFYNNPTQPEPQQATNPTKIIVKKPVDEFARDEFRAEFDLRPPPAPPAPKRGPGRPIRYLHPKQRTAKPRRPHATTPDPELVAMAKRFEMRREATLERRAKLKNRTIKKRKVKSKASAKQEMHKWLKKRYEARRKPA